MVVLGRDDYESIARCHPFLQFLASTLGFGRARINNFDGEMPAIRDPRRRPARYGIEKTPRPRRSIYDANLDQCFHGSFDLHWIKS